MTTFTPKIYQQQVLDSIEAYFKACHELPSPSIAFTATTERLWGRGNPYNPLSGISGRYAVLLPARAHWWWQDLAGSEKRGVCQHASAALRAQRDLVVGSEQADPRADTARPAQPPASLPYCTARSRPITVMDLEEAKSVTRQRWIPQHDNRRYPAGVSGGRRRVPQGVSEQRRADASLRQPVAHPA